MHDTPFRVPIDNRYFEDYITGSVHEFGPIMVEEKGIVAFAKSFDPQLLHTDSDAAKDTVFGGLIARWLAHCRTDDATLRRPLSLTCGEPRLTRR